MFLFPITPNLENAVWSVKYEQTKVENQTHCDCIDDIIVCGVIPMIGSPNGYLSGYNGSGELYEGWYDSTVVSK